MSLLSRKEEDLNLKFLRWLRSIPQGILVMISTGRGIHFIASFSSSN
jgi:hypothetical protein